MLPASSWARVNFKPPRLPPHITHVAADPGAFVATRVGDYSYSAADYVRWLDEIGPALQWAGTMDYCCFIHPRENQQRTTERAYEMWRDYKDMEWVWVPTIQGDDLAAYVWHANSMKSLITDMQRQGAAFRVGVGTLVSRPAADVARICAAVHGVLGQPLHAWGVKLSVLKQRQFQRGVISIDTSAWDGQFKRTRHESLARRKTLGMSKAEFSYLVALPEYAAKIQAAVLPSKQLVMEELK